MPNSRRRKFSVQNHLVNPPVEQRKTTRTGSNKNLDLKHKKSHSVHELNLKKGKSNQSVTVPISSIAIEEEDDDFNQENTSYSFITTVARLSTTVDQEVMASSSLIDLVDRLSMSSDGSLSANPACRREVSPQAKCTSMSSDGSPSARLTYRRELSPQTKNLRQTRQDKPVASRREKTHQQHCVTVRSPKRKVSQAKVSVALSAIDLSEQPRRKHEETTCCIQQRISDDSVDDMCRICHGGEQLSLELGSLISACACRGTVGRVHVKCLERWLTESGKSRCELCGTKYATRRVHKYGFPKAFFMWILSQNAKQLMVDSLGIMLMSPLAVLAAWLSGRTLAGLMTQDSEITPWPLASTFVLACMTLVCYYCWIVSAATRHALGWWIWYRSQYEVRLELDSEEISS